MCLEHCVEPDCITLELTETHVARDAVRLIDVATRLRLKGFTLSIDDFGTGQSGLSKLQKLPFNELKIDRQFVNGCSQSTTQRSVVEASLALARSLKMVSVAEGVQDRPDWDLLGQLGCDVVQGYFIARPMSEEGLKAWTTQWTLRES
jgi:EAL domain-containing protein (putative c-di-GMP-specific phosphodiesterase class I)